MAEVSHPEVGRVLRDVLLSGSAEYQTIQIIPARLLIATSGNRLARGSERSTTTGGLPTLVTLGRNPTQMILHTTKKIRIFAYINNVK